MKIIETIKFASIETADISAGFIKKLDQLETFTDVELGEHLYSVETLGEHLPEEFQQELMQISALLQRYGCAYFRIVTM